ncbi:MAG: hypothetical protein ACI8P9_005172 [Parasphingorhabdus sp.]|jgi:hypothetical protein
MTNNGLEVVHQLALQRLNNDFAYYLDHNHVELLTDLFTKDAYYRHGIRESRGRDEIRQLFIERATSGKRLARHVISGLRLDSNGEHSATGNSVVVTWAANGSLPVAGTVPHLVADFTDEYHLCDDARWRINKREIERIFVAPGNQGPIGS